SWSVLDFFVEDDTAQTPEDQPVTIDVSTNDVVPDGATVTLHPGTSEAGGTVVAQGGQIVYTPPANFDGTDRFTYTASDGTTTTDPATVTVTVRPVNDAPGFAPGPTVKVAEDSGRHHAPWATAISAGPNEAGQSVHFVVDQVSNPGLFATPPTIGDNGILRFR